MLNYDYEPRIEDPEDLEPQEPQRSGLDLWSKESVDVIKAPAVSSKDSSRKGSSKSLLKLMSDVTSKSVKSRSTKRLPKMRNNIPESKVFKQYPLKKKIDQEIEEDDNKWRKHLVRKAQIEENFRKAMEIDRHKTLRGINKKKTKILTNLAIDSRGKLMRKKKVDIDKLPTEEIEHATVKVHNGKKLHTGHIDREDYEKLLNDPSNPFIIFRS